MQCPSLPPGFWLNWWPQIFIAVGTVGAVLYALFGDLLKARFVKLRVSLENPLGVYSPTIVRRIVNGQLIEYEGASRYYQLRISNSSSLFPAQHARLWILAVDLLSEGTRESHREWTGEVPLKWQHEESYPVGAIGNPRNADVCAVSRDGYLTISTAIGALGVPTFQNACWFALTLQVKSDQRNSAEFVVRIKWNGKWSRDDHEMAENLEFVLDQVS